MTKPIEYINAITEHMANDKNLNSTNTTCDTLKRLEASRGLNKTGLLMFPDWFDPKEWKIHQYLQGGTMCTENSLSIDYFDSISFIEFSKNQKTSEWFIHAIARDAKEGKVRIVTIKKR